MIAKVKDKYLQTSVPRKKKQQYVSYLESLPRNVEHLFSYCVDAVSEIIYITKRTSV